MPGDLTISVDADLGELLKALKTIPGIGAQEARDMVTGIRRELRTAERDAASSAGKIGGEFKTQFSGIEGAVKRLGEKMGGTFGMVSNLAVEGSKDLAKIIGVSEGAGLAIGGVAVAATGAVMAIGGTVAAAKSLADAGIEARDRLEEAGMAATLPPEALESLEDYQDASANLNVQLDELKVIVGGAIADDLAVLATTVGKVVDATSGAAEGTRDWVRELHAILSLGLSEKLYEWRDGQYEQAKATQEAETATREWAASEREALEALGILIDDHELEKDAQQRSIEAKKAAAEAAKLLAEIEAAAAEDSARAREEVLAQLDERVAAEEEATQAIRDEYLKRNEAEMEAIATSRQLQQEYDAQRKADAFEMSKAIRRTEFMIAQSTVHSLGQIADAVTAGYEARLESGEHFTKQEREQALISWDIGQGLAYSEAVLAAIATGANVIESLTALGVPMPAAIPLGAAATGTVLAGQVAAIASQPPPEFPVGRSPDHPIVAAVQRDEAILSRRAVSAVGGRDAIAALNRGQATPSSQGGWTLTVDPKLGRLRVVDDRRMGKRTRRR